MNWINAALGELFALFVDNVRFTIAILAWIAFATLELPKLSITISWDAPLLFLGCAIILVVSVWRAAKP